MPASSSKNRCCQMSSASDSRSRAPATSGDGTRRRGQHHEGVGITRLLVRTVTSGVNARQPAAMPRHLAAGRSARREPEQQDQHRRYGPSR